MSSDIAVLPKVGHGLRRLGQGLRVVSAEVRWWLAGGWRLLRTAPRRAMTWLTGLGFAVWADVTWLLAVLLVVVVLPGLYARWWPASWERRWKHPAWRRRIRRRVRRTWPQLMEACGLSRRVPDVTGAVQLMVPELRQVRWEDPDVLVTVPRLMLGQTVDDVVDASDRLRVAVGSRQVRIIPNDTQTGCTARFLFGDPLAQVFYASIPDVDAPPQFEWVELGVTEDGQPFGVAIRRSRLTGGASGSGKAAIMHATGLALGPAIKAGLVRMNGIDLKGGMEQAMARPMYTRYTSDLEEAVVILEDEVAACKARAAKIAGIVRTHEPTVAEPLSITVIDELAQLTSYASDTKLIKRADAALRSLLTLGRAPGFLVHAYVQDPRKDTVPQRHLFHEFTGLRLNDRDEVAMIFGEGAIAAGVACHKIPYSTAGIGYALDDQHRVTRFRAGHVTDDMIRTAAARFPAPRQIPIVIPQADEQPPPAPRARAPRKPRAPRGVVDDD